MATEFYLYFIPTLILFNIALIPFYKSIRVRNGGICIIQNNTWLPLIKWFLLIFCIFGAFGGDWFHYKKEIEHLTEAYSQIPKQEHLEDLYVWIIQNVTWNNYLLFRSLIWVISLYCLKAGFKRLKMDTVATWSCFFVLSVAVSYAVGRGSLGFSLIIWGYSYLLLPGKNKLMSYIKGCVLLSLSLFCHKSMFLLAPLTLISFINFNVKKTILVAIAIPLVIGVFRDYILMEISSGNEVAGSAYFTGEQNTYGIGMNLWRISYYFLIFAFIIFIYYRIVLQRQIVPLYIRRIFNMVMLLLFEYLAIYFAFTHENIGSDDLSWRIFAMINIPLPIVVSYFLSHKVSRFILYLFNYAFFMANYFIIYNAYTNY